MKSFEIFKEKCINNQGKFQNIKEEEAIKDENNFSVIQMPEDEEETEEVEDLIEYEEEEEIYEEESIQFQTEEAFSSSQDEVAGAVEKILDISEEKKSRVSMSKRIQSTNLSKKESTKDPEKYKAGKESYQRLLQQCDICQKMIEKNRMEGHINKHNNFRPFSCPECQKSFYCKQLLRLHRTTIHTNVLIRCEICLKMFPSTRALYSHTFRHKNQDRYKCEFCEVNNFN